MTRLPRHFVEKPWGQDCLPASFDAPTGRIGEVWYDRPEAPLPLLCKWLFTSEKLSVQVHPDDDQARERGIGSGKEECWIVTSTTGDARLGIGLKESIGPDELREASLSGAIEDMLDWKPVKAGDWFHIQPGTIHAIGAGVQLVEIQQNADVTYRLYDYGRPRELHLDDGVAVSIPGPYDGASGRLNGTAGAVTIFNGRYFRIACLTGKNVQLSGWEGESYLIPVRGVCSLEGIALTPGEVALGELSSIQLRDEDCQILVAKAI